MPRLFPFAYSRALFSRRINKEGVCLHSRIYLFSYNFYRPNVLVDRDTVCPGCPCKWIASTAASPAAWSASTAWSQSWAAAHHSHFQSVKRLTISNHPERWRVLVRHVMDILRISVGRETKNFSLHKTYLLKYTYINSLLFHLRKVKIMIENDPLQTATIHYTNAPYRNLILINTERLIIYSMY